MMDSALDDKIVPLNGVYLPDAPLTDPGRPAELDLGCGKGSFTTELARRHPERLILAADMLSGRLRKLVKRNERENITNVTALKAEARMLISRLLPDGALCRLHTLCPDPWPKDRHRGNRLLSSDFMAQIHRVLAADGIWHFSTDDLPYLEMVAATVAESGLFAADPAGIADIADIRSDFEQLWNSEGKTVTHYAWRKLPMVANRIGH